jgi:cytochrome b561
MAAQPESYSTAQKILHWTIAVLIAVLVPVGLLMANVLEEGTPLTNTLYEVHKSIGLTVFGLALVRIAVRWRRGAPPLVPGLPAWQRVAARTSHYSLYVLIVLVPLIGWAATSACCAPVNWFWTVPLTLPIGGGMDRAKQIFPFHYALAFTLTGLVIIHLSAALHHHFVRRDETLRRMLPGQASSRGEREKIRVPDGTRRA